MNSTTRLLLAITTFTLALATTPVEAYHESAVVVVKGTAAEQALVDEVVGRFESHGIELPPVEIAFHHDRESCLGNLGYYVHPAGKLDMCNWGQHYRITPATTLLHELGHALTFANMSEAEREAFVTLRGLEVWHGHDVWWHNGQEQAAEIVAWAVGGDLYAGVHLDAVEHSDRVAAARLLLGDRIDLPEPSAD